MMFTEGLDESAISWIKQGTDSPAPAHAPPRSPLAERPPLGQVAAPPPRSPALHARACGAGTGVGFFSPKGLPPVRTTGTRHSGLLGRHSALLSAADSDEWEDGEEESVASWGMPEDLYGGNFSETADEACSSDSSLVRRAMERCGGGWDEEVTSQLSRKGGGIVRGQSKEFLRVEVRAAGAFAAGKCSGAQDPLDSSAHGHYFDEHKFQTPSAPPIAGDEEDVMFDAVGYDVDIHIIDIFARRNVYMHARIAKLMQRSSERFHFSAISETREWRISTLSLAESSVWQSMVATIAMVAADLLPVHGGVVSRELFHDYIMVWIEDTRLHLLDNCKAEKASCPAVSTISPFVEQMYEQIKESIHEYGVAVADVEREIMKTLEKQYMETLMPLRDGIPKYLEKQLGAFMNTVKRMLDVLHCRVEDILKSWAAYLTITSGNTVFGEQMNSITVMLRKKYKNYLKAIVDKLVTNAQANRNTRLKRILEETREADGESDIRERMQAVRLQLSDTIHNLHEVFSSRILVAICRGFWDRLGQIVLRFLESRKENRIWYRGSDYALGILDDVFASEMQKLLGNALQDKDLDPPQSVIDARSILC
nr:unnamed protein product [Digitaria exilis]